MMNNPIRFTDAHFLPQKSVHCHLLIHLDTDSYSYAIVDQAENRLYALVKKHYNLGIDSFNILNRFSNLQQENEHINLAYSQIKISVNTGAFTFIPDALFAAENLPQYSAFTGASPDSTILNTYISSAGINNIVALETELTDTLTNTFDKPLVLNQANPFIAGIFALAGPGSRSGFFINFNHHGFEAALIDDQKLKFYNSFEITATEDFNYFLLNMITQLSLDPEKQLTVSGAIDSDDKLYEILQKYFGQIIFAEPERPDNFSESGLKLHQHFSLLSLDLCE